MMLQSQENAVSEFIHLPASGCLGNTVFISPEESRPEKIPLDSGGMKKPGLGEGGSEAAVSSLSPWSGDAGPCVLPRGAFPSAV